jgi:hypothetical protein
MTATKKFLCLCYYEEAAFQAWTPSDHEAIGAACEPHDKALRGTGKCSLNASLASPAEARVIRGGERGPVVSKGPYVQTGEPYGAMFIVDAADMDEAVRIASLHPGVNVAQFRNMKGGIEVRELEHFA